MAAATVEVHLFAAARAAVGTSTVNSPPGTLRSMLSRLVAQHAALEKVLPRCSYLIDGLSEKDLDTYVQAGSRVDVLPPFAGG